MFSYFLIKEVIVIVGDGGGCGHDIHLLVSCYNMASIKQQVSFCCSSSS